jgi:hypothetical protein
MNVADAASYSSVLLLNLSDNLLEQSQKNTVVVQQEERTGWDLNHSRPQQCQGLLYFNPRVDWQQFRDLLLQRMNERTTKGRLRY